MPPVRKAGRKDSTQAAIVAALRAIGCEVRISNQEGWPDLYVHHRRFRFAEYALWLPVEVKRPRGHLTPLQADLRKVAWFPVVSSVDEALALFNNGCIK
jgi:hypothetical protein